MEKGPKEMKYIAIAEHVHSQRKLIPANESLKPYLSKNGEFYSSLYNYKKEHLDILNETKTLSGIKDVKTDKIFFDFDDKLNINNAQKDVQTLCTRLIEKNIPKDKIGIYFTGGKGYHVEIKSNQEFTRKEFKNIVFNLASDLNTFDTKINDEPRIIRVPLTKHQSTGLYKIPITFEHLFENTSEEIAEFAKEVVNEELLQTWDNIDLPDQILELKDIPYKLSDSLNIIDDEDLEFDIYKLDFRKCPRWLSKDRYALQEGFFYGSGSQSVGERNEAFMILAATYKHNGINEKIALKMLEATAELQAARTGEDLYSTQRLQTEIINLVYSKDWSGGIYSQDAPLLVKTRSRFNIETEAQKSDLITYNELFNSFYDYASNIEENTIYTGLPIDKLEEFRLTIGMPVALLGSAGSGKTSVALNILKNTSLNGINSLFFSMDMHKALVCQKQIHLITGHDSTRIFKNIEAPKWRKFYQEELEKNFSNVHYCTKSALTIEDIRYHIQKKKDELGDNLKLVVIDYLETIVGKYSDTYVNISFISNEIKNIAVDLDICIVLLVQPPKIVGGAAAPLTNMMQIKGPAVTAQAMRVVIGIYREGFNPHDFSNDKFITFVGLKNTMGGLFKMDCHWDGMTSKIRELNYDEQDDLESLRKNISENKVTNDF